MREVIKVNHLKNQSNQAVIETELEVLTGIQNVTVDVPAGTVMVEFEEQHITLVEIVEKLRQLGFPAPHPTAPATTQPREITYYVKGMHCASCEVLIENKLLKTDGVKSVEASTARGTVMIENTDRKPTAHGLSKAFKEEGYSFFDHPVQVTENASGGAAKTIVIAAAIIAAFIALNKFGIGSWIKVSATSSLPAFFLLGVLAGLSSCAALVGRLILSMSKQWVELYDRDDSTLKKFQPHLMFNVGRLVAYGAFGAILGGIGSKLQVSPSLTSFLVITVSVVMVLLGLQMLGVKALRKFQLTMPKAMTRYVADESKFKGRYMPSVMGALTFFFHCGFTITDQGLALLSGSPLQGGLMMFLFALGTAPTLIAIGVSSIKFSSRPHWSARFLKIAGILVLFFALFNINAQMNVLGFSSLSDISLKPLASVSASQDDLPPLVDGKQVLKMNASSSGYEPNYFKIKANIPVRWEITDVGTSGCTNAVVSRGLFSDQIPLTPGQTSVKEFTPTKPGKYKFSCWMGMISGVIEVVVGNDAGTSAAPIAAAETVVPSGAKGCGCGGGGSGGSCGAAN